MEILRLEEVDSTNTWLANHEKELPETVMVYSHSQRSGRGQRGNSWESEPGRNITASIVFHPEAFDASRQFLISEAVALAIVEYLEGHGIKAEVKWPNDIYVGDKKICGILVEHVVTGRHITRTIAGFGINLNQEKFYSDAPNPVSLYNITGEKYVLEEEVEKVAHKIEKYLEELESGESHHQKFLGKLWRKDGNFYKFRDVKANEMIEGCILDVADNGLMTIAVKDGGEREYAFKEVEFIL